MREIIPELLNENIFKLIGREWMLICAGNLAKFNMMTASWGGMGILWNKPVAFIFVRPVRHTFKFIEESPSFTLSFFEEEHRKMLNLCGSKSGRDIDKVKETGLKPVACDSGVYFEQARLVVECKKIYHQDITPATFIDKDIDANYPNKDYHRMYIGEITKILSKE